jgi:hypothetical protein
VEPIINTPTEPAKMSPVTRWVRTFVQVIIAVAAAIPAAAALLDLSAETAAKVTGFAGAAVLIVSALHNALNQAHDTKTEAAANRDRGAMDIGEALVVAILVIVLVFVLTRLF